MNKKIRKNLYTLNKVCKVGAECNCPGCGEKFIKKTYSQAFCRTKNNTQCKDKYWNQVDPNKRNNKTRISPASQIWLNKQEPKKTKSKFLGIDWGRLDIDEDNNWPFGVDEGDEGWGFKDED